MEFTKRHPVLATLVSLLLSGACCAAPALALADAAPVDDAAAVEAVVVDQTFALGGLQLTVPGDWTVQNDLGMVLASNPDGTVVANLTPVLDEIEIPVDQADWGSFFGIFTQGVVESLGATVVSETASELEDGTPAYVYGVAYAEDGVDMLIAMCYVPVSENTFTLCQIGAVAVDEAALELADAVSEGLLLATDEAVELPLLAEQVEAGGISMLLPGDFVFDEEAPAEEPEWYNEDGTLILGVIPVLVDELSTIGVESLDLIAEGVAAELGGSLEDGFVQTNGETDIACYMMLFADGDTEFLGVLGMVPLADDTVTGVMALMPVEAADGLASTIDSVFASIQALQ